MKRQVTPFKVINQNFNQRAFEAYDVMPYFMNAWRYDATHKHTKDKMPKDLKELRKWVEDKSRYMYWARCEYEIIICGWPNEDTKAKWDIHKQLMMNLDLLVRIIAENVEFDKFIAKNKK
jgi:hypothetical protein